MILKLARLILLCCLAMAVYASSMTTSFAQDEALAEATASKVEAESNIEDVDHEHAAAGHATAEHAVEAHAATPPLLQFDLGSAVVNIAIFLGVFAILSKFVWPVILGGLKAREDKMNSDLENAERINREARSLLGEYQTKLDEASGQVQAMLAEARRDAETSAAKIVADAKADAERTRDRAIADIETAKKVALSELAGQTSEMAMNVAKSVVGRELRAEDHADLIRQSLDRLPSNN